VRLNRVDIVKEGAAVAGWAVGVAWLVAHFGELPAEVPIHFGFSGLPDAWAPRGMVWIFPAMATFLYAALTLGQYYGKPNVPWTTTRKNRARIYRVTRNLIWWLKVQLMWMFAYIHYMEVQIATHRASGLGHYFAGAFMAMPFFTMAAYFYIAHRIAQQR
jgi:hypothetical protein